MPRAVFAALPPGMVRNEPISLSSAMTSVVLDEVHRSRGFREPLQKGVVHMGDDVHQGILDSVEGMHIGSSCMAIGRIDSRDTADV